MNNNKIINCSEGINENDVCTMKNLRNLPDYQSGNELNMNNQRITGLSDRIALNYAVNIKQLNNLNINMRNKENFSYKTGRLTLNRYGISIIYKAPTDTIAIGILLISKNDKYIQQPIVTKGEYTIFIPIFTDINEYNNKNYYFYYWKCNISDQRPSIGLNVTPEEFNNLF